MHETIKNVRVLSENRRDWQSSAIYVFRKTLLGTETSVRFKIVEGNHDTGGDGLQVHRPFPIVQRIVAVYKKYKVV